mgnify:CR=1 FL=1|jgi:hypothetical protein
MEAGEPCPICYAETPDTIVCWNAHAVCNTCYGTMLRSARSQMKNCAECRAPMFRWDNDGTQDPVVRDRRPADRPVPEHIRRYRERREREDAMARIEAHARWHHDSTTPLHRFTLFPEGWFGRGMNYEDARLRASQMFYALQARTNARERNAIIRRHFPQLWEGRRTFRLIQRDNLPSHIAGSTLPWNRPLPSSAPRAPPRCSACGQTGHIRTNRSCPMHPRNRR